MSSSSPRAGYTLPVFACAAAVAALQYLQNRAQIGPSTQQTLTRNPSIDSVTINLVRPEKNVEIPIEQVAQLQSEVALAITRSDPGDNLDLTRHTPIWARVHLMPREQGPQVSNLISSEGNSERFLTNQSSQIILLGGEGLGYNQETGQAAIYQYAQQLFQANIQPLLTPEDRVEITIILPQGRKLAQRTSNAAFGIVEGLSLLGTSGIAQPLSAPEQLQNYQADLETKAQEFDCLVFCIGENGLDLAQKLGISTAQTLKTANWIGPMLVTAGLAGSQAILLLGYHGKLIKLAGGIFHTHHHLADGRLEILTAHCANLGMSTTDLQAVFSCPTTEAALQYLYQLNQDWITPVYGAIASAIDQRSTTYIWNQTQRSVTVGSILFNRDRQIIICSENATALLSKVCYSRLNNLF